MIDFRRIAVIVHDTFMVVVAWLLAVMVRVGFQTDSLDAHAWQSIPLILLAQTPIFW